MKDNGLYSLRQIHYWLRGLKKQEYTPGEIALLNCTYACPTTFKNWKEIISEATKDYWEEGGWQLLDPKWWRTEDESK